MSKPEEAIKYLNKARELGREDAWIHLELGLALGDLGKMKRHWLN